MVMTAAKGVVNEPFYIERSGVPRPTEERVIRRELAEQRRAEREQQRIQKLYQQWEKLWREGKTNRSWQEWLEEWRWRQELYPIWEALIRQGKTNLSWQSWLRTEGRRYRQ